MHTERMIVLLDLLVLAIANQLPPPATFPSGLVTDVGAAEWAYIKGLASGRVIAMANELRAALREAGRQ